MTTVSERAVHWLNEFDAALQSENISSITALFVDRNGKWDNQFNQDHILWETDPKALTLAQSSKNNAADFILRDINGKEIKSIHKNISAGNSQLKINTRKLNSGIYFIQCITKDGTLYRKVVVNRQP